MLFRLLILVIQLNFAARLKQGDLTSKNDIADFLKNKYFDEKLINMNKKS